jgi:5'-methylthioadenosine phosphorylase
VSEKKNIKIGIIGGTGSELNFKNVEKIKVYTPFGNTSSEILIGDLNERKIAFLSRHGIGHSIPPHKINYRANIWALKDLGVKFILSLSAVGSLRKEHNKGKFLLIDQYIDRTKRRLETYYEGGQLCHISQADPTCNYLNNTLYEQGKKLNLDIEIGGTYVCIEGPRFSTRAESKMFRLLGGDVIGMTIYPEITLASEKEICYSCIAMVTDLDVWAAKCPNCGIVEFSKICSQCGSKVTKLAVNVPEVLNTMQKNAQNLKKLLETTIPLLDLERDCDCHHSLEGALI